MSFVHLHTHSHYSLLDGLTKIPELISAVKEKQMSAVALTDHGNMYGAIEFYQEAKKQGVKPVIGIEAYVAHSIKKKDKNERPYHIILLAQNKQGYENLIQLTTIAHLEGFYGKPRIDFQLLKKHSKGLIVLSGCLSSELSRTILHKSIDDAKQVAQRYVNVFGLEHYYLEIQQNPGLPNQEKVNAGLLQIHRDLGIQLVATNDSHYINHDDSEAQDVLLCVQTKNLLADENRMTMKNQDLSLARPQEMIERFADFPHAVENTNRIAEMVNIELDLGSIQIPHFELPVSVTPDAYLRELCEQGIEKKYGHSKEDIVERLDYELDIIQKTGFASYFLIVQDFINWAKQQHIEVGPGRGSAAGSIVAYLTNITDIDPIRYELLFERFLNPERVSQPDIDTDFADTRRDDVLQYVEEKYGKDHVAQIITFGTMAARAAIRDVGRVLGLSYGYCDRIAKMIPMFSSLNQAIETVPELAELIQQDSDAERLLSIAKKLEGVVRHTSTHACAVVITKDPLHKQVPLQVDQDGNIITQYSMHPIDSLGLLKMDFLGLKNLTIIEHTLEIIEATIGEKINIEQIPLDDKRSFRLLQKADTVGVFQLESSGMRRYLKKLKPTEMEDIIAMVSLYRPGPMDFIPEYIDGKHGKRTITYLDERLKPILKKTYGIAVYQEQIMEIARQLAGYTYGEADVLRKAVGKKIKSLLDEQEQKMISGMVKNTIAPSVAKQIWEFILPFARYGFNRSHAACYAMIAYRTAYLKANYPAQFMAALMTADYGNTERIALEVHQAQEMNIHILPPNINESFGTFTVVKKSLNEEQQRIRFGLKAIKNVGDHIVSVIIRERKAHGTFTSLEDFLRRVQDKDLNKKSLESLIKCGAIDDFGDRNILLLNIDRLLQFAKQSQLESTSGQSNLFHGLSEKQKPKLTLSHAPTIPEKTRLQWEKELLGLYISGHPLEEYREALQKLSIPFGTLKEHPKNKKIRLVGMLMSTKKVITKKGDPMLFATIADDTAEIEALVFPKTYRDTASFWQEGQVLTVRGRLDDKDGSLKILVEEVENCDLKKIKKENEQADQIKTVEQSITVQVPKEIRKSDFEELKSLLTQYEGEYHIFLEVDGKKIDTKSKVKPEIIPEIERIFGQQSVHMIQSE